MKYYFNPTPHNPLLSSLHSQPKASGLLYVSSQTILQIFLRSSPEFLALCLLLWQPSVSVLLSQSNQLSHPLCEVFHEWVETVLLHCEPVQLQFLSLPLQRKQRNCFFVFTESVWLTLHIMEAANTLWYTTAMEFLLAGGGGRGKVTPSCRRHSTLCKRTLLYKHVVFIVFLILLSFCLLLLYVSCVFYTK